MSAFPLLRAMRLSSRPVPFNSADWLFELKHDGFRSLAYVQDGNCRLVSRRNHTYRSWPDLCTRIAKELKVDAVLDGELVCLDEEGRSQFYELMFRRSVPVYFAFDLLWVNGEDLRSLPLVERKKRLRKLIRRSNRSLLYVNHLERDGCSLFEKACALDLEGIVAKLKTSPYIVKERSRDWLKIKNPEYSQAVGREELFESK